MKRVLVTGAGGFIGSWLTRRLKQEGYWVRGVDIKYPGWSESEADQFWLLDLRTWEGALTATRGMQWVFHTAADMGGMGFISEAHARIIRNNTQIDMNVIEAARQAEAERFLFTSSACVYPQYLQVGDAPPVLKEEDAYPADPQDAYGWEKLHTEHLCKHYREAGWLETRVVRQHNVYGPEGTWRGGREKAPAALCRKIAFAKLSSEPTVEIWGDGQQRRSYMYIDDCVEGLLRIMKSDFPGPLNLGRDRAITVDELADIIAGIAGIEIEKNHISGPEGVRSRNSDNTLCQEVLGWLPGIPLEEGLIPTYEWIESRVWNYD